MAKPPALKLNPEVENALRDRRPVVALESTVIAHGLPRPLNLETAVACENAVREAGALPATIGVIDGLATVGLTTEEIEIFASRSSPDGTPITKVNLGNLAAIVSQRGWGATTVAASLQLAHTAGLRVFATGGIGGVHRGAQDSFDISSDLAALSRFPMICVCAGAKSILDLPRTVEALETLGVVVVGYETSEFPAFYSTTSGLHLDVSVQDPVAAASLARHHWSLGSNTSVLICAPVPKSAALNSVELQGWIDAALQRAGAEGARGKETTPFLLRELERLSSGATLKANRELLINNARVAARISAALSEQRE
jgi:pseudouridylate synthase